jgi:hypothetical protein
MSLGFPLSLVAMLSQLNDQPFGIPLSPLRQDYRQELGLDD